LAEVEFPPGLPEVERTSMTARIPPADAPPKITARTIISGLIEMPT